MAIKRATREYLVVATLLTILTCPVHSELQKVVDLTWSVDNETIYWPGSQPFLYTKIYGTDYDRGYWYAVNEFCAGEHVGTHFDAPFHFSRNGWKVADVPLEQLIAKGAVVDLQEDTKLFKENTTLEVKHLQEWETNNGPFDRGSVLLVKFGHSQYWTNRTQYLGLDDNDKLHFPGVSKAAAQWLVDSGKFYGVGVDTASVDPGNSKDFIAHRILNHNQMYILENVKLIEEIPIKGFTLFVMPMKLKDGTGAPMRLLAVPGNLSL